MNILMIAGEASGDLHGSSLASALLRAKGDLKLQGVGGRKMEAAGVELLGDVQELGVVGIVEVLAHWQSIWKVYRKIRKKLYQDPPDLLILIDYPDFNLRVARIAKQAGVPVVYYISPQLWAWRRGRVRTISRLVDKMLVIFPFERALYEAHRVRCDFVGHPLLDQMEVLPPKESLRSALGLQGERVTVGLLPGSRRQEVRRLLPPMLDAIDRLRGRLDNLQAVVAIAPSIDPLWVRSIVESRGLSQEVALIFAKPDEVISASDAVVVASGTATLQAAVREIPMVIVYKVLGLTYLLGKMLIQTRHIGLVNVVAQEGIVPELLQSEVTPEAIEGVLFRILTDAAFADQMKKGLAQVRMRLGSPGASARAAQAILDFAAERQGAGLNRPAQRVINEI